MAKKPTKKKAAKKPGPEAERLKLEGPWQDRVRESFKKPPPPKGGKQGGQG